MALHGVTRVRECGCQVRNQGRNDDVHCPKSSAVETLPSHYTVDFEFIFGHLATSAFYCCQTLHTLHAVVLDITWGLKKLWLMEPALKAIKASVLTRYYSLPSGISGRLFFSVHTEVTG